jgi:hypothetical protein
VGEDTSAQEKLNLPESQVTQPKAPPQKFLGGFGQVSIVDINNRQGGKSGEITRGGRVWVGKRCWKVVRDVNWGDNGQSGCGSGATKGQLGCLHEDGFRWIGLEQTGCA